MEVLLRYILAQLQLFEIISLQQRTRSLVIMKPSPMQMLLQLLGRPLNLSILISILYPQNKASSMYLGKQIVIQSSPQSTNMQISCRRWRKSYSYSAFIFSRCSSYLVHGTPLLAHLMHYLLPLLLYLLHRLRLCLFHLGLPRNGSELIS